MAEATTISAKLVKGSSRMGWSNYWLVDEEGRQLHTEPVCLVPDGWHDWFKNRVEEMEVEYWGVPPK